MIRRARPALGTLVELGAQSLRAIDAAFAAMRAAECALSKFDPASDISRFNSAPAGASIAVCAETEFVLFSASVLTVDSGGAFDITQGSGPRDWSLERGRLRKYTSEVRIDLGGIGKGYAVDCAFEAMCSDGPCWVNAGGDLRVSDGVDLPIVLRDESTGGVRPFLFLSGGAIATSLFASGRHISVAAPFCMIADALTKAVHVAPKYGATVWVHA